MPNIPNIEGYTGEESAVLIREGELVNAPVNIAYRYKCLLSQSGTADPTAVILFDNFIGEIVWTRYSSTEYRATLTGAFPETLTFTDENCTRLDDDTITVVSAGDDTMSFYPVEFSVNVGEQSDVVHGLTAGPEILAMLLEWTDDSDEYWLQRRMNDETSWMDVYRGSADEYLDFDLTEGTEYVWRIRKRDTGKLWGKWIYITESTISAS
jgi:hypothetical protein